MMDLDKEQQIVRRLYASGKLSDVEYVARFDELEWVRQEVTASMMKKVEEMQKDTLCQVFASELAKKDTKAANRPCFNGLDKYTTRQLKEELQRRKGK